MTIASLLVSVGLAFAPLPADTLVSADSAMSLLKSGGYTIMWRHAQTDRSVSDIPGPNTERFQQRNLTDHGVAGAKGVGAIFKTRAIPVGEVVASPMFRTLETAQYAFGRATTSRLLRDLDASPEERALILAQPAGGTNRVLVTHHFIIERNAPGIKPGDVGEGEAVVLKSDGNSLRTIAVIKVADWVRMIGASPAPQTAQAHSAPVVMGGFTPEMAKIIHSGRGFVALSYFQSFNTGRDAMKAFFEHYAVQNPARTLEQRLDAYDKLKADLGSISMTAVETVGADELLVKATSQGKPLTITFKQETQAPYRAVSINVQYHR